MFGLRSNTIIGSVRQTVYVNLEFTKESRNFYDFISLEKL